MNVRFEFDHLISKKSLLVNVDWPKNNTKLDLQCSNTNLVIDCDLPVQNQAIQFTFACDNILITQFPLIITNIVLDNFYSSKKVLYRGVPEFDQKFLNYAKNKNIYIDTTVEDSNRLDFTGKLTYQFIWPFYKNVYL